MRKEYIKRKEDQQKIWDEKWAVSDIEKELYEASNSPVFKLFERFLPSNGKILDAGCGLGGYLLLLKEKGYDVYGIDFSKDAISQLKKYNSSLNVQTADCEKIPFPDSFFDVYLSLGVVEHIEHGPLKALKEAQRVLKKDGLIIISVPYMNFYRRIKDFLIFKILRKEEFSLITLEGEKNVIVFEKSFRKKSDNKFFQYYFTSNEIKKIVKKSGFNVIFESPYSVLPGLLEINLLRKIYNKKLSSVQQKKEFSRSEEKKEIKPRKKHINLLFLFRKIYKLLSWEKTENSCEKIILRIFRCFFGHMVIIIGKKKWE